jgi:hypothetical protein
MTKERCQNIGSKMKKLVAWPDKQYIIKVLIIE